MNATQIQALEHKLAVANQLCLEVYKEAMKQNAAGKWDVIADFCYSARRKIGAADHYLKVTRGAREDKPLACIEQP